MSGIIEEIKGPSDVKKLSSENLRKLAKEIRDILTTTVSLKGGHLAANLGVVELTIALHCVFNSPRDKIIWDVGHQSYVHKLLTGRKDDFSTLRCYGGLSGFPKCAESPHDVFQTGHSSTSVSAALGMAKARDLKGEKHHVIAVIGDGALTGGMAFEALNHASHTKSNLIVVLNDNEMSISKNVGGMSAYLSRMRSDPAYSKMKEDIEVLTRKIPAIGDAVYKSLGRVKDTLKYLLVPGMLFEELGFTYLGPIDGHNMNFLRQVFVSTKKLKGPVLIHVLTKKGKGFEIAEKNPDRFHGIGPFNITNGDTVKNSKVPTYTEVFSKTLIKLAEKDKRIIAVTAAMPSGTGLDKFAQRFPDRFFDVGIAEQHALTFSAGMAREGFRPVVAVYSTFLQRGYDQVVHDICLQKLPVILAVDRAGIVGEDGETHQGTFDLCFLRHIPNMVIMAPKDERELQNMFFTALQYDGPVAIRYPRGNGVGVPLSFNFKKLEIGKWEILDNGPDVAIFALGAMVPMAQIAVEELKNYGVKATLVNSRYVKPLDQHLILSTAQKCKKIITVEESTLQGGFGSAVLELLDSSEITNLRVKRLGICDYFVEQGSRDLLLEQCGLSVENLVKQALDMVKTAELPKIKPAQEQSS